MTNSKPFIYKLIIFFWVVVLLLAVAWQFWSSRPKPAPPGWKTWRNLGSVLGIGMTPEGVIAGGSKGLFRIDSQGQVKPIEITGIKNPIMVYSLLYDRNGILWVGHDSGLSYFDGKSWQTLTQAEGLPDPNVRTLAQTKQGDLWIGTNNGAVCLQGPGPWTRASMLVLTPRDGLLHGLVSAILEDQEGGIWFGNYAAPQGGLSRLKDRQWQHWTPKQGLPHANITCLILDPEGRVWAGCGFLDRGGAVLFSAVNGSWNIEKILPAHELAGIKVRSLFQDSRGRVWIGSENDGLAIRSQNKTLKILTTQDGLANQEVLVAAEAPDKAIWLGTIAGLNRIGPEALAIMFAQ